MAERSRASNAPTQPEVGVVGLVPDDWNHLWQPRHHVLTQLARYFHVVWVNPAEAWNEILTGNRTRLDPLPADLPGFAIYRTDWWLPRFFGPAFLDRWTARKRLQRAVDLLRRRGCRKIVLYLWRPEFAFALDWLEHDASVYHIDDEYSFQSDPDPVSDPERELISRVDRVIVHSPQLYEAKGHINPRTSIVPNGADFSLFKEPLDEPDDLSGIPKPRVGYCGYLKHQLDWDLLDSAVDRLPQVSFVFVGKTSAHYDNPAPEFQRDLELIARMREKPNVWFLGEKTAREMAAYAQHLNACLLPYRLTGYTHCIYPMKLHEYLAAGRPVIGTKIRSLLEFDSVVHLVEGSDQFQAAIERCLGEAEHLPERVRERRELASKYDWSSLTRRIADQILEQLGSDPRADPSAQRERD